MKVNAHLPDWTTPAVDLLRVHEGPEAPTDIASEVIRHIRLLVQRNLAWSNSSPVTRGSSRLFLTDDIVCVTQTHIEAEVSATKSGLTPEEFARS